MKLFTLNTHSLSGDDPQKNVATLAEFLADETPHVIALQEVNQIADEVAAAFDSFPLAPVTGSPDVPIKKGNFLMTLSGLLSDMGIYYHMCYLPVKRGYGIFDEGLALLSTKTITNARCIPLGGCNDYGDWRTRAALLCEIPDLGITVCNLHTSRADDKDSSFLYEWERLKKNLPQKHRIFLMGDFNCPAHLCGGGYEKIISDGYFDMYRLASKPIGCATVNDSIDGWRDVAVSPDGMRIDFIFSNQRYENETVTYRSVLDGVCGEAVSDHFGITVEII